MGKKGNKSSVKNNIFKVAGARSLKAKNKAKLVTSNRLKQLNVKNREIIENIDQQLTRLNTEIRKPTETNIPTEKKLENKVKDRSVRIQEEIRKYNETEENCEQALNKLTSMEM